MTISREDFAGTTKAKSDQINAVDLVGGPVACRITGIRATGAADQPIAVSVDAHAQPWKPSKTFRRVLLLLWPGTQPEEWIGRDVVLWCDPDITWAGEKVGGVAISHASHISGRQVYKLAESKSKRKTIIVEPYYPQEQAPQQPTYWPDEKFDKQVQNAEPKIRSKETTADAVIAILEKKALLTEGQKSRLRRFEIPEVQPEPIPDNQDPPDIDPFAE